MARSYRLGGTSTDPIQGFERFANMLSIPYVTPAGVVGLKFRALDPERKPKYDAPSGQHARLFNVEALHSRGNIVAICEGEIDAIVMTELVGIPAVGVPGASHWADYWPRCFSDYEEVIVIADSDLPKEEGKEPPGQRHARRVVNAIPGARLVLPPPGEDVNSWVLRDGADAVREACGV